MKNFLLSVLLIVGGTFAYAANNVPMQIIKEGPGGDIGTYAPARPWYIIQDDYELTLPSFEDDYTLELRDSNDTVVYTSYLYAGTTTVVLPSTLSGDFEIHLVPFSFTYYYRGYISL